MQSLGYFLYDLSLEVIEFSFRGGRRSCRQDDGLVIPKKKLRERFSLWSANESRSVVENDTGTDF